MQQAYWIIRKAYLIIQRFKIILVHTRIVSVCVKHVTCPSVCFKKTDNPLLLTNNCQQQTPVVTACVTCYHCSQSLLIHLREHLFNLHKVNLRKGGEKKAQN